jgi:hypothetical protein
MPRHGRGARDLREQDNQENERSGRHPDDLHARRHLSADRSSRPTICRRCGGARPRAARRDGLARCAPDRRARRRRHAHQQGRDRVEVDAPGVDVDYLFAQVDIGKPIVDTNPSCGNMLAGVAPFAIETGIFPAQDGETHVMIYNVNT